MQLLILGGFLGSGKTSLLVRLARYVTLPHENRPAGRVAILENEIGKEGVDDKLLRSGGYQVETLFNGCVCCTLGTELVSAVELVQRDQKPDWIFLETTGLAYPGLIQDNIKNAMGISSRICTVTDASRWHRLKKPMGKLFSGQIDRADVVLLNKSDLCREEELLSMEEDIRSINTSAILYRTSALHDVEDEIWEQVLGGGL